MKCVNCNRIAIGTTKTLGYPICGICRNIMNEQVNRDNLTNRFLVFEYPFLLVRNYLTDEVIDDYNYEFTMYDDIPIGWRNAFGMTMIKELKNILINGNCLHEYRVVQIKEKFGQLRWYDNGVPDVIYKQYNDWLDKYTLLSERTCIDCGEPAIGMTTGWIVPVCEKHAEGQKIERYKI